MKKIKDPVEVPGKLYLIGMILFEQGKYKEALDTFAEYHNLVGEDWETLDYVASCHRELGQQDGELQALWRMILEPCDEGKQTLDRLIALLGVEALDTIFADDKLLEILEERLVAWAESLGEYPVYELELKKIVEHLKTRDAESESYLRAASALNFMLGNLQESLDQLDSVSGDSDGRYHLLSGRTIADCCWNI